MNVLDVGYQDRYSRRRRYHRDYAYGYRPGDGPNFWTKLSPVPQRGSFLHGILLPDDLKVQDQFSPSHNKLVPIREAPRLAPVLELNVAFFAPVSRNGKCFPASRESRLRLSPTHAKQ